MQSSLAIMGYWHLNCIESIAHPDFSLGKYDIYSNKKKSFFMVSYAFCIPSLLFKVLYKHGSYFLFFKKFKC